MSLPCVLANICMRTSRFLDFVSVACYVYATMHNEQSRARSREVYADHPE